MRVFRLSASMACTSLRQQCVSLLPMQPKALPRSARNVLPIFPLERHDDERRPGLGVLRLQLQMNIDYGLQACGLEASIKALFELSAAKIHSIERCWNPSAGAPVFTVHGKYTNRDWTEWTQGFQFGSALLQFDATGEPEFLEIGRRRTLEVMAPHLTHMGVHDHGFNNVSTYGNLLRLFGEGRFGTGPWEQRFYELALKCSGAVQASRWSNLASGGGFIYSFNGPHSLFVDTIRTLRALALSHRLGH